MKIKRKIERTIIGTATIYGTTKGGEPLKIPDVKCVMTMAIPVVNSFAEEDLHLKDNQKN